MFSYSPLEEMRESEAIEREDVYAKITAKYGEVVTDALKAHYSLYDERFYLWFADLYDPGKYDKNGNPLGGGFPGGNMGSIPSDIPDMGGRNPFGDMFGGATDYITEVNSAMNLTVVFQMIGVGLLLTLIASAASVLFIMRYDPLKILANRD